MEVSIRIGLDNNYLNERINYRDAGTKDSTYHIAKVFVAAIRAIENQQEKQLDELKRIGTSALSKAGIFKDYFNVDSYEEFSNRLRKAKDCYLTDYQESIKREEYLQKNYTKSFNYLVKLLKSNGREIIRKTNSNILINGNNDFDYFTETTRLLIKDKHINNVSSHMIGGSWTAYELTVNDILFKISSKGSNIEIVFPDEFVR